LRDTLERVSAIKSTELRVESHGKRGAMAIVASVEVYGHPHRLLCKVADNCESTKVKQTLMGMRKLYSGLNGETIPVLIAPVVSEEAQALCRKSNTGFIDFHGNARLDLDEVFLVMHSMNPSHKIPSQAETLPTSETARFAHVA
jgi:hypothetical protein